MAGRGWIVGQNEVVVEPEATRCAKDATQAPADEVLPKKAPIRLKLPPGQARAGSSPASGAVPRAIANRVPHHVA